MPSPRLPPSLRSIGSRSTGCWCRPDPAAWRPARSAAALGIAPNTLSFHFDRLRHAGLVSVARQGRSLIYAARYETMNNLLGYLTENCCGGQAGAVRSGCVRPARNRPANARRRSRR